MCIDLNGPAVLNPDAFDTEPELHRELDQANQRIREYAAALQERDASGHHVTAFINDVLRQHLRGDHRGVAAIIDSLLEASPRLSEKLQEANESNEIRQISQWAKTASSGKQLEPLPPYNCEGEDPWSKKTVPELRRALDVANRAGVGTVRELKSLKGLLEEVTKDISKIVVAHMKGDRDVLSEAVAAFCEKRVVVKGDESRKVH